ncbi:MAG: riboflavin synthase [Lachnospiraceae bacterium]|nr:riboflavin synthase [Lachnospiraceae bacterium]
MFTGIIEEVGEIQHIQRGARSAVLEILCQKVLEGTKVGDSIAVNGICLTVISLSPRGFRADVMPETLARSCLAQGGPGTRVNLERAMAADGRFGGHMVAGHIDGTGTVTAIREDDNAIWYTIAAEAELLRYIVEKGSIAINGISLTVAAVSNRDFQVSIIPHPRQETNLPEQRVGSTVNLECDVIGKYVEKLLTPAAAKTPAESQSRITLEFLAENGF